MNYQVWIKARDQRTLEEVAAVKVYAHADRLRAENVLEHAQRDFAALVDAMRCAQPGAVFSTEMVMPKKGMQERQITRQPLHVLYMDAA